MNNPILIGMMGCGKSTVGRLAAEQLGLFAPEEPARRDRAEKLERVMDRLREKYGHDAVTTGTLLPRQGAAEDEELPF